MALADRLTAKARARLEQQVTPDEKVLLSTPVQGAGADHNLPLTSIHDVAWKKGLLGSQCVLTIRTSNDTLEYKAPNKQGEPAAALIRQAMTEG